MPADSIHPSRLDRAALRAAIVGALPHQAVLVVDGELRIVLADGAALRRGGGDPAALEGRPVAEVVAPELVPRYVAALAGQAAQVVADGALVTLTPLGDPVDGVLAVAIDLALASLAVPAQPAPGLEASLREAIERFEAAFEDAPIGMALVGLDGRFLRTNRALQDVLGYSDLELVQRTFQELTHPDDLDVDLAYVDRLIGGMIDHYAMEKRYFTRHGHVIWALLSVSLVRDAHGQPLHFISQVQDISEGKRNETRLRELAERDPVTDLLNRRRFEDELARQIERCHRYDERACLLLMDIDGFKAVNDEHGHQLGDAALRVIGRALRSRVRDSDTVARVGGDEFAAILLNVSTDGAARVADEIRAAIAETPVAVGRRSLLVTVSIGTRMLDRGTVSGSDAFRAADEAMYAAKRGGRNRVEAG